MYLLDKKNEKTSPIMLLKAAQIILDDRDKLRRYRYDSAWQRRRDGTVIDIYEIRGKDVRGADYLRD